VSRLKADISRPKIRHLVARFMFQSQRFGYPRDAQELTVDSTCCRGNICSASTLRNNGFIFPCLLCSKGNRCVGTHWFRHQLLHSNVNLKYREICHNTFPQHKRSKIEGYPLLGNPAVNTHSGKWETMFSVGSVPKSYKRAQSENSRSRAVDVVYRTVVESSRVESSELAAAEMTRKELDCAKKTSHVI
jgi:hypothetical protein